MARLDGNTLIQANLTGILLATSASVTNTLIESQGLGLGLRIWNGAATVDGLTVRNGSSCIRTLGPDGARFENLHLRGCDVGFRIEGGESHATQVVHQDVNLTVLVAVGTLHIDDANSPKGVTVQTIASGELTIRNSTVARATALDSSTIDARSNYWGSPLGPTSSQTTGNVSVVPWLQNPRE